MTVSSVRHCKAGGVWYLPPTMLADSQFAGRSLGTAPSFSFPKWDWYLIRSDGLDWLRSILLLAPILWCMCKKNWSLKTSSGPCFSDTWLSDKRGSLNASGLSKHAILDVVELQTHSSGWRCEERRLLTDCPCLQPCCATGQVPVDKVQINRTLWTWEWLENKT